jgi:hypothetical protein
MSQLNSLIQTLILATFIYTLDHRKKKNLVASNFTERNFPITFADIHAICLVKTVILCPVSLKEDVFDNCDLPCPDSTDDIIDLVQYDSESTHSTQSDDRFSYQGREIKREKESFSRGSKRQDHEVLPP